MKGNTMTYEEFQAYMANYGFIVCPMTREEYGEAFALGAALFFLHNEVIRPWRRQREYNKLYSNSRR